MAERTGENAAAAAFDDLAEAAGRYLDALGWTVGVIGPARVQQQPLDIGSMRFEFVLQFTGKRRDGEAPSTPAPRAS